MATGGINNYEQLQERITALKSQREVNKKIIIDQSKSIYETFKNPVPYIKQLVKDLAGDSDFRFDLLRIGLNAAGNYFSGKVSPKSSGAGSIVSFLIEKITGTQKEDSGNLLNLITRLFTRKKK